ncbi:unnamed protein product, partial [marine sediment metagenome]
MIIMLLLAKVFQLSTLFAFEMFALVCAVFLVAYVEKQGLSKLFKIVSYLIAIAIILLAIATVVFVFMNWKCG